MRKQQATELGFEEHIRVALKHIHQPDWLGEHSPLATPYFLEAFTFAQPINNFSQAQQRGEALATALRETQLQLWGGVLPSPSDAAAPNSSRQYARILDLNYFHQAVPPALLQKHKHAIPQSVIYNEVLHISRASHDRYLQAAVQHFAAQVLERTHPNLFQALPAAQPVVARERELELCFAALQRGQTVNVIGAGGTGKTAFGAQLAQRWAHAHANVCWLTRVRSQSLVFALAHAMQRRGRHALWAQLAADGGQVRDMNLAVELLRQDLQHMPDFLVCVDDADHADEAACLWLSALRGLPNVRLLLMGQRVVVSADVDCVLGNFDAAQLGAWLQAHDWHEVTAQAQTELLHRTGGNPRLLAMLNGLRQQQPNLALHDLLKLLGAQPSLAVLLQNTFQRLPQPNQTLLKTLSVFATPAPFDLFSPPQRGLLQSLAAQGWLEWREGHSVGMAAILREWIFEHAVFPAQRRVLHQFAAQAFAARGNVFLAGWHFVRGGFYEAALAVVLPNMDREIRQGNGVAVLELLARIPAARLSKSHAALLSVALAQLYRAQGLPAPVVESFQNAEQPDADEVLVKQLSQLGWAHEQLGNLELSLTTYAQSQQTLDKLLAQTVSIAVGRGRISLRKRDMNAAMQEAQRALYQAERLQGIVFDELGNPAQASAHFLRALAYAEALGDGSAVAFTCNSLGVVAGRGEDSTAARTWLARAMHEFERAGNTMHMELARANLGALFTTTRDFANAIEPAERAFEFFRNAKLPQHVASTAATLAEAHFNLGSLGLATMYANVVIAQEETQFVPYGLYTLGDVRQSQGDVREAKRLYAHALRLALDNDDRYMQAYAQRQLGAVCLALGEIKTGSEHLATARQLFVAQGMHDEAARTNVPA